MMTQLVPTELRVHTGDVNKPGLGLVSERFNDIHATTTLEFNQVADHTRFVTAIQVAGTIDGDELILSLRDGVLVGSYRGNDILLPIDEPESRLEVTPHLLTTKVRTDTFQFVVNGIDAAGKLEFAWYFINQDGEKEVVWYSERNWIEKTFDAPGSYRVEFFVKYPDGTKDRYRSRETIVV